ncbi:MOSC domain-containing protein [Paraburkholderia edwinii]|uniref:MOSC domain-containing protein n=1 Tax=Paraburkholderia edwinii TaxID=2861782 RepID=A0ABX8UZ81_9BURK|nr:MOSC domain-containing protein [Paraburkholderia edwinii]QYD73597.1 MOSC domain-containing protein [Paraburkholderia edwinii]
MEEQTAGLKDTAHEPGVEARLLSINVGQAQQLDIGSPGSGLQVESAIRKRSISTANGPSNDAAPVEVGRLGLAGDEQADLSVHGGLDKAVYLYPVEHYEWWRQRRIEAGLPEAEASLVFGALGENLTTQGVFEKDLWIGDVLVIGDVALRVEAPRTPCFKLNAVMGYRRAVRHMFMSGFAGVYLSVANPGLIRAGSSIALVPGRRQESINAMLEWRRGRAFREP